MKNKLKSKQYGKYYVTGKTGTVLNLKVKDSSEQAIKSWRQKKQYAGRSWKLQTKLRPKALGSSLALFFLTSSFPHLLISTSLLIPSKMFSHCFQLLPGKIFPGEYSSPVCEFYADFSHFAPFGISARRCASYPKAAEDSCPDLCLEQGWPALLQCPGDKWIFPWTSEGSHSCWSKK